MTTIAHSTSSGWVSRSTVIVLGLLSASGFSIGLLEMSARHHFPMAQTTLSTLFYAPAGNILFPLATMLLATAILQWARILRHNGSRVASFAALAAVGLTVAVMFPTDPPAIAGPELSVSAQIHRYAAAVMFVIIPVTALVIARKTQPPARSILTGSAVLSIIAAVPAIGGRVDAITTGVNAAQSSSAQFALTNPDTWWQLLETFATNPGLTERVQLVLVLVIVATGTISITSNVAHKSHTNRRPSLTMEA